MKRLLIFLILASVCFAANEVHQPYASGSILYFRIFNAAGEVYNTSGAAFESWNAANVTDYDVALAQETTGSTLYVGTFPNLSNNEYSVVSYLQAGGTPATGDGLISADNMVWIDGSEFTLTDLVNEFGMPSTQAGRTQR